MMKTMMKALKLKRIIAVGVLLGMGLALVPFGQGDSPLARRKKKKKEYTGTYENGVFTDSKYGLTIEIPEAWSMKVAAKGESVRFVAARKEYSIPPSFRENEFLTTVPMIKLFVDTSSLDVRAFVDSLKSKTFSSEQKKKIYSSFKVFDGKTKRPIISRLKLDGGQKGLRVKIMRRYHLEVPRGVGQVSDVVTDNVQGDLAVFKSVDGKNIIIVSGLCESLFYRGVNEPYFVKAVKSLNLSGEAGESGK